MHSHSWLATLRGARRRHVWLEFWFTTLRGYVSAAPKGDAKRRKLEELDKFRRNVPQCSASALSAVLEEVKRSGLPELSTRADLRDARDAEVGRVTEYGELYQTLDLERSTAHPRARPKLNFIHPFAVLVTLLQCVSFFV